MRGVSRDNNTREHFFRSVPAAEVNKTTDVGRLEKIIVRGTNKKWFYEKTWENHRISTSGEGAPQGSIGSGLQSRMSLF